jgi:nitrogen fixation-related uncharacterized protein
MSSVGQRPEFINIGLPRWFLYVSLLALCVAAGAAWWAALNGRYELSREGSSVLDTRTGELCGTSAVGVTCVNVVERGRRPR